LKILIIPARGGSKGILKKNLRTVNGISLIERTIKSALQAKVDIIIVSTDDSEIKGIASNYAVEIHDRKTLTKFSHEAVIKIAKLDGLKGFEDSEWKFYSYLHYEVVVYKTNLTIGNAVALPEHFYNQSNEKNLIKFDNYDDNLCFWRCLAVFIKIMDS
jgi:hypothetical protein